LLKELQYPKKPTLTHKFKVYVEEGNNSRLIKEILRKRSCIRIINDKNEANIFWSSNLNWEWYWGDKCITKMERVDDSQSTKVTENEDYEDIYEKKSK